MKIRSIFKISTLFLIVALLGSCKSEFEKIRTSGDPDKLYKKAFEYYENEEYQKAQTLFELVISNLRGKVESEKVYFYYAYTHYYLRKYLLAAYYFKDFNNKFLNSSYREEANFMSAYSNYKLSPNYRLDQSYTEQAIKDFEAFTNAYPDSERVAEANKLIDEMRRKLEKKAFAVAQLYFNLREYQSATHAFENLLKDYPDSPDIQKVRFRIIEANFLLAQNSVISKQEERYKSTLEKYSKFKERYKTSAFDKQLQNIFRTANKKLKQISNDRYKS